MKYGFCIPTLNDFQSKINTFFGDRKSMSQNEFKKLATAQEDDYPKKYQKEIEEFNARKLATQNDHITMTKKKKNRGKKKERNEV